MSWASGSAKVRALWLAQGGECFYCGGQAILGPRPPGVPKHLFRRFAATVEHLARRADGGDNRRENLVMACVECNCGRGETPVLIHFANRRAWSEGQHP